MNNFDSKNWELINLPDIDDKLSSGSALVWWEDTFESCMKIAQYSKAVDFRIDWEHHQIFTTGIES
jgi:hypothetical protein